VRLDLSLPYYSNMESISIKTAEDIAGMRIAGKLASEVLITLPHSFRSA
jgi:hypothetical protein